MQTYWFDGKEYNMDVSQLKQRPKKDLYSWNMKNHWLKKYWDKQNDLIRYVHYALEKCGWLVPRYKSVIKSNGNVLWVNDISFDMSFVPEFGPALEEGWRVWRAFDYDAHGTWATYCEAHMLRLLDKQKCLEYVKEWGAFARGLHGGCPRWIDDMIKELGAEGLCAVN